jgi:hypothetical protein
MMESKILLVGLGGLGAESESSARPVVLSILKARSEYLHLIALSDVDDVNLAPRRARTSYWLVSIRYPRDS